MSKEITPKKARPRDLLWDALVEALGYEAKDITKNVRGQLNAALGQLREVGATPLDIKERVAVYRFLYCRSGIVPTPMGIVNRWADCTSRKVSQLTQDQAFVLDGTSRAVSETQYDKAKQELIDKGIINPDGSPRKRLRS